MVGKLEEETGREERPDACEEEEEEEEVHEDSRGPGSSKEEGMQSHVSRSENLEKLNISRTLQDKQCDLKLQHQIPQILLNCSNLMFNNINKTNLMSFTSHIHG